MTPIYEIDFEKMVLKAQTNLNEAYKHYSLPTNALSHEFVEIKLQTCIFQYDVCVEMTTVLRNQPIGFALSVALKGLVLRLFEFDARLRTTLLPRLLALAEARDIAVEASAINDLKRRWKAELKQLKGWHPVRNHAAGHYDQDVKKQVEALETVRFEEVMSVAAGFLQFAQSLIVILRDAGQGVVSDQRPFPVPEGSRESQP